NDRRAPVRGRARRLDDLGDALRRMHAGRYRRDQLVRLVGGSRHAPRRHGFAHGAAAPGRYAVRRSHQRIFRRVRAETGTILPDHAAIYGQERTGTTMNLLTFDAEDKLDEAGAGILCSIVQTKPNAVLGLATGGTPIGIYEQLAASYRRGLVSFADATTFNLDEYVGLPADHAASYRTYMSRHLFDCVDLSPERTHIPRGDAADPAAECRRYDELIRMAGQLDVQLLGLGHNGHIGFNEPAHSLLG